MPTSRPTVVACFGNVLRGDDGLGEAVARRLSELSLPDGVDVLEVGIGGIHLVQRLLDGVDALVVVDAVDLGRPPGTVVVVRPDVLDVASLPLVERRDQLADVHYATPERALMLARALGVLPDETWLVGCQVTDPDAVGQGLSPAVTRAVDAVVAEVLEVVADLGTSGHHAG